MSSSVTSSTYSTPTGMTGAGGGDMLRLVGLNTGLDVDSIVKKLMTTEQSKIDSVDQQQQLLQWKQEAYQDIISSVKDFQSTYFDVLNSDTYALSPDFYSAFTASSSTPSVATATAGVGAKVGTYNITVNSLASSVIKSGSFNTSYAITLANWGDGTTQEKISFNIDGGETETITLNSSHDSIVPPTSGTDNSLITDINNQINANSNLKGKIKAVAVDTSGGKAVQFQTLTDNSVKIISTTINNDLDNISSKIINPGISNSMEDLGLTSSGNLVLSCNDNTYNIDISSTDTLEDVINKVSSKTNGTVTASYSQLTGSFTLNTSVTGSSQSLSIITDTSNKSYTSDNVLNALGLENVATTNGSDANIAITPPGSTTSTTINKSSNNFTIDGITYNLLNTSSNTTITVTQDADKLYKKISDFIDKYNAIIDKIQTKLTEKQDSNDKYAPLTDTQKSQMSQSEIDAWNEKAKVGILNNDDKLESLLSNLRSAFNTAVTGNILSFGKYGTNAIGIDTYDDYEQGGKIYIANKSKLMDAINNHLDQVVSFFSGTSNSSDSTKKFDAEGVFTRINDMLTNNVGIVGTSLNNATLTKYANFQDDYSVYGSSNDNTLPDQLYSEKQLLDKLNTEYKTKQENYYEEFSKLETAMETLNAQSSTISNYFSS